MKNLIRKYINNSLRPDLINLTPEELVILFNQIPEEYLRKLIFRRDNESYPEFEKWFEKNADEITTVTYTAYLRKKNERIARENIKEEKETQFFKDQEDELYGIPPEFARWISSKAWERGHSAGYDEVLNYVRDYVSDLGPIIENYTKRILSEK